MEFTKEELISLRHAVRDRREFHLRQSLLKEEDVGLEGEIEQMRWQIERVILFEGIENKLTRMILKYEREKDREKRVLVNPKVRIRKQNPRRS